MAGLSDSDRTPIGPRLSDSGERVYIQGGNASSNPVWNAADQHLFYVSMTGGGLSKYFAAKRAKPLPAIMIRFFILLPRVHCGCSLRSFEIVQLFLLAGAEKLVDFRLHAGISDDQFG